MRERAFDTNHLQAQELVTDLQIEMEQNQELEDPRD